MRVTGGKVRRRSGGEQGGERGDGHDEADGGHHDAATAWRLREVTLVTRLGRRADERHDVAGEQGPAEREEQPDDQVVTEQESFCEHLTILAGTAEIGDLVIPSPNPRPPVALQAGSANAQSRRELAALTRAASDAEPSTTTTIRRPSRIADATRQ